MNKIYNNYFQENYKIDKSDYFNYINKNNNFTDCQKKTLINYFNLILEHIFLKYLNDFMQTLQFQLLF
jgi:hypothetical protein